MDVAVSVRKQAVVCMSDVLRLHPTHAAIQIRWLDAVMPLVLDSEDSVRTKVVELLQARLLDPVTSKDDTAMTRYAPGRGVCGCCVNVLVNVRVCG